MSKETTAKLKGIIDADISTTQRNLLASMGALTDHGILALTPDRDRDGNPKPLKKMADLTVDPEKTQVMGNVFVTVGPVKQRVALFLNTKGEVFASANIKSGTNFTHRLPVFVDGSYKDAWNAAMKVLPKYLAAEGTI